MKQLTRRSVLARLAGSVAAMFSGKLIGCTRIPPAPQPRLSDLYTPLHIRLKILARRTQHHPVLVVTDNLIEDLCVVGVYETKAEAIAGFHAHIDEYNERCADKRNHVTDNGTVTGPHPDGGFFVQGQPMKFHIYYTDDLCR